MGFDINKELSTGVVSTYCCVTDFEFKEGKLSFTLKYFINEQACSEGCKALHKETFHLSKASTAAIFNPDSIVDICNSYLAEKDEKFVINN